MIPRTLKKQSILLTFKSGNQNSGLFLPLPIAIWSFAHAAPWCLFLIRTKPHLRDQVMMTESPGVLRGRRGCALETLVGAGPRDAANLPQHISPRTRKDSRLCRKLLERRVCSETLCDKLMSGRTREFLLRLTCLWSGEELREFFL